MAKKDNIIPFKWPLTESGAREFRNISVRVFDEPMRIQELKVEEEALIKSLQIKAYRADTSFWLID